jgi:DNA-binding FadR family transcriptional regulator
MIEGEIEIDNGGEQDDDRPRTAAIRLLGTRIVAAEKGYRRDDVLRLDKVMGEIRGSRTLAREVLQALEHKGMVTLKTRVGATVQPLLEWKALDPDVIDWRLKTAPSVFMRSLTELREGIEPRAAFLAAQRASAEVRQDLVNLAKRLKGLAEDQRFTDPGPTGAKCRDEFQAVDAELHRKILEGSNNEIFRSLALPVEAALKYRIKLDWEGNKREDKWATRLAGGNLAVSRRPGARKMFPGAPRRFAMWLHYGLAHSIEQSRSLAAETFARAIIAEIHEGRLNDSYLQNALLLALRELDLSGFAESERDQFFEDVMAVAAPDPGALAQPAATDRREA